MDPQKKLILDFLSTHMLGVISTVDTAHHKPESALVTFSETKDLEIIFGTDMSTRKFKNLKKNPEVAFVTGWERITIQYEGTAKMVKGKELEVCRKIHIEKNPVLESFALHATERFFKVTPRWIRYSDFSGKRDKIIEIDFPVIET